VEFELEDRPRGIGRRRKARAGVHQVPAVGKSDQARRPDRGEHGAEELSCRLSAISYQLYLVPSAATLNFRSPR
jgi:hypothetical protein